MIISIEYEADKVLDLPYWEITENTVLAALDYEDCSYEVEVSVIFTDNDAIQEINREHHRIDASMDVPSFPMVDYESPSDFDRVKEAMEDYSNPETGGLMLGDIVVSIDKVEERAERYGHSRTRELVFLTAHSMLHLSGYDHMEDDRQLMMEGEQKEVLEIRGYTR